MRIVINNVCPEHVAGILDAIRKNRIPDAPASSQPSNWYMGIEVLPNKEEKP